MRCFVIPALSDNYIFLLHDPEKSEVAAIDPGEARPVLTALAELGSTLGTILLTHHHRDHIGGVAELRAAFPKVRIFGSALDVDKIPGPLAPLRDGDDVTIGSAHATVLSVPGHTLGHIAYHFPPGRLSTCRNSGSYLGEKPDDLFCGDTLFGGGCGRLFEGTPQQMKESLAKIARLPDATRIWFAHEYTIRNLEFAATIEPNNHRITTRLAVVRQQLQALSSPTLHTSIRQLSRSSVPSTLAEEKATNPFLRCHLPEVQGAVACSDPLATLTRLRELRNKW